MPLPRFSLLLLVAVAVLAVAAMAAPGTLAHDSAGPCHDVTGHAPDGDAAGPVDPAGDDREAGCGVCAIHCASPALPVGDEPAVAAGSSDRLSRGMAGGVADRHYPLLRPPRVVA